MLRIELVSVARRKTTIVHIIGSDDRVLLVVKRMKVNIRRLRVCDASSYYI